MLLIICLILFVLIALPVALMTVIYRIAFFSNRKKHPELDSMPEGSQYAPYAEALCANVRRLAAIPCEKVYITSRDGLRLAARYYNTCDGAPVVIMFHGYRSTALRDASGGGPYAISKGMNVLLVDQRAHGESEGRTITFGIKERFDCKAWVDYIIERCGPDVRIMLQGISMGAATVLMATDVGLPSNVKCIAADCGYSSPEDIIHLVAGKMGLHAGMLKPFIRLTAGIFGGFSLTESSPVSAAASFEIPVLLIHGDDDRFVPCDMSRLICAAAGNKCRLVEVRGAGHGMSYYVDRRMYEDALDEISACLYEDI